MSAPAEARINLLDLPTEILDIILDDLYYRDLKRCCLVSRSFLPLARKFLFDCVDLLHADETSKPLLQMNRLHDRSSGTFLRRQATSVEFLSTPACIQICLTASTREIHLDLSSHAIPHQWLLERLEMLFIDPASRIAEVNLLLPGSRFQSVLAILLDAPSLCQINLYLSRDHDTGPIWGMRSSPGLLVIDCSAEESILFLGDYPFYRPKQRLDSHAKIVAVTLHDRWTYGVEAFLRWVIDIWPRQPTGFAGFPKSPSPTATVPNAFQQLMIRSYRYKVTHGEFYTFGSAQAEAQLRAEAREDRQILHDDNMQSISRLGYRHDVPLDSLNFYGFGRDWVSFVGSLAADHRWLPTSEIHLWLDCICDGNGQPQAVCVVTLFDGPTPDEALLEGPSFQDEDAEDDDDDDEDDDEDPDVSQPAREIWTCDALYEKLEGPVSTIRNQRLVVEHVVDGEDCFIGIRFLRKEEEEV